MLRNLFFWLLLSGTTFALAACCGSVSCDKQDDYADALIFQFKIDSTITQGFSSLDVDTVFLKRYTPPTNAATKGTVETIQLIRAHRNAGQSIVINNNAPFTSANNLKLNGYSYTLFILHWSNSKADTVRFALDSIQLKGNYQGDGCCTYYVNTNKGVKVSQMRNYNGVQENSKYYDVTKQNGQDQPITLYRY